MPRWLHAICSRLWRYWCFAGLRSWHQTKPVSHFDTTDLSSDDGRAFLQFPEDMIHAVKVKLHTLKHMTASEQYCGSHKYGLGGKWKRLHANNSFDFQTNELSRRAEYENSPHFSNFFHIAV